MMGLKINDSCRDSFKEMKIWPLCCQYMYSLMQYVDNNRDLFTSNTEVHNKGTRQNKQKQTPWPLVRERTIPTDRPPLVDEI
jgi:hypothetical protein